MTSTPYFTLAAPTVLALFASVADGVTLNPAEVLPALTGLGALAYALIKITRQDANWEGLLDGLKAENQRKDERITNLEHEVFELRGRIMEVQRWESERVRVLTDLAEERRLRREVEAERNEERRLRMEAEQRLAEHLAEG